MNLKNPEDRERERYPVDAAIPGLWIRCGHNAPVREIYDAYMK
jgi:hypothetical protein